MKFEGKTLEGWKTESLGSIAQLTMGQSPDSKYYSTEDKDGMPFLQGCAEFQSRFPVPSLFCMQAKKVVGAKNFSPLHKYSPQRACVPQGHRPSGTSKTIGSIVRGFKIGVTKWMRANTPVHDVWQRNYYEHIVRNNNELNRIHEYIASNPARWESDHLNLNVPSGISGVRESDAEYARETWMT